LSLGILRLFSTVIFFTSLAFANGFDFTLIKKGEKDDNNTLLIVGGIQGDEPGGFMAASLLSTHYKITKGSVWIVPNFNFYSIIKRSRAPHGDMNRKFAYISKSDPDFKLIERMKSIIAKENIKMVINLHDGSGFYRKKYIDKERNPKRWGQCNIIDQAVVEGIEYGNLLEISQKVDAHVNENLLDEKHKFHTKNTHTYRKNSFKTKEMSKTLTYYAISRGKASFGNESSKSLPVYERVYYKLLSLEKFMDIMGIEYKREFDLNAKELKNIIDNDIFISFNDKRIFIPLSRIRSYITYFPVEKGAKITFKPSSPVMTVVEERGRYIVYYGNRKLTTLIPQYLAYDDFNGSIKVDIDGVLKDIGLGSLVEVKEYFNVKADKNLRINVIGYINKKHKNESGLNIRRDQILKRFSIDKDSKRFRVEVYDIKDRNRFLGMFLVEYR